MVFNEDPRHAWEKRRSNLCEGGALCEGIKLPDCPVMGAVDENGYKYLGLWESVDIMQKEMKEKVKQGYLRMVEVVDRPVGVVR